MLIREVAGFQALVDVTLFSYNCCRTYNSVMFRCALRVLLVDEQQCYIEQDICFSRFINCNSNIYIQLSV